MNQSTAARWEYHHATTAGDKSSAPLLTLMEGAERAAARPLAMRKPMVVAGLFAGIGGIELGLADSGHETSMLCEIDEGACAVLKARFPHISKVHRDVRTLKKVAKSVQLITAGFPCQDLSQAGKTVGIAGARSGLVGEVFRLLEHRSAPWVLIENVPFMMQLSQGRALDVIISALEHYGYSWAYRVIDAQAFGIPQRRRRVFILASLDGDPRDVLLSDDAGEPIGETWRPGGSFGFYWTEGVRGLGAAVNAVPTLKGGSAIGIASPPAIVLPDGRVIVPDLRDAERLQGFDADWTMPAETVVKKGFRWKYVGNAVAVHAARWLGGKLREPSMYWSAGDPRLRKGAPWPDAAWNVGNGRFVSSASAWPQRIPGPSIHEFLLYPGMPLSIKATSGFLSRAERARLRFPTGFLHTLREHLTTEVLSAMLWLRSPNDAGYPP